MLYRKMPVNADELSILGFGCMRLPVLKDGRIDEERATRQIQHAIDQGVNYLDTAWAYHMGESEAFLGRALADGYREKIKLATKLPSWMIESRGDMDHFLDAQLKKLQTRQVDYYLLHALNGTVWEKLDQLGVKDFMEKAKSDGRIVNIGFSFHGIQPDFKTIVDAYAWDFCQIQYNYLDEEYQAGTQGLKYAASKGLGVIVMEPLRGGNLGLPIPPVEIQALFDQAEKKRTPVEWALRWVWDHPEVTVVLSGMNEEAHVEQNLAIAEKGLPNSLSENELTLVKRVGSTYKDIMQVNCTGCGYCQPCPEDVNIPACFEVYNKMHMFGNVDEARMMYAARFSGILTGTQAFASQCVNCGECLEKCPQQLEIPVLLENVVNELEGSDLNERVGMARKFLKIK